MSKDTAKDSNLPVETGGHTTRDNFDGRDCNKQSERVVYYTDLMNEFNDEAGKQVEPLAPDSAGNHRVGRDVLAYVQGKVPC